MNAVLVRDQTYKFGPFKFYGKRLSRVSIRTLQKVYGKWNRDEIPLSSLIAVMQAFKLTYVGERAS